MLHIGSTEHKGKLISIFRSIGALARGFGPFLACTGTCICRDYFYS